MAFLSTGFLLLTASVPCATWTPFIDEFHMERSTFIFLQPANDLTDQVRAQSCGTDQGDQSMQSTGSRWLHQKGIEKELGEQCRQHLHVQDQMRSLRKGLDFLLIDDSDFRWFDLAVPQFQVRHNSQSIIIIFLTFSTVFSELHERFKPLL